MPRGIYQRSPQQKERLIALNKSRIGGSFTEEHIQKLKDARLGRTPAKGMKHTKEIKEQIALSVKKAMENPQVKEQMSINHRGEKAWNWKGGRTTLKHRMRTTSWYRQWRSDVYTRDNFACMECGDDRGGNLNAHHITTVEDIFDKYNIQTIDQVIACEALWDINNGVTLCKECHVKIHSIK